MSWVFNQTNNYDIMVVRFVSCMNRHSLQNWLDVHVVLTLDIKGC